MNPRESIASSHYPPRARGQWIGRRARLLHQAIRAGRTLGRAVLGPTAFLVPGVPFILRRRLIFGSNLLTLYSTCLLLYLRYVTFHKDTAGPHLSFQIGRVHFQPVYLLLGCAAALHIYSVTELVHPFMTARFSDPDLPSRHTRHFCAILLLAALVFLVLYAPLL